MDMYPIKFNVRGGSATMLVLVSLISLTLNYALNMVLVFLLAYAAAKGWAAAS